MFTSKIKTFMKDDSGATAIEYGLIAALVSVAAILALQAMGTSLEAIFTSVSTTLDSAVTDGNAGGGSTDGGST
ncbi:MAG: Flp family type IVb pilin [Alphaproteobacteria bacterium]